MNEILSIKKVVTLDLLAAIYDPPKPLVLDKVQTRPDNYIIRFIQAVGLIAANCRDSDGNPVPVLMGGKEGFAGVLDDESILVACPRECWPEASLPLFDGAKYSAGFLFVVPGNTETLRMKGTLQAFLQNSSAETLRLIIRLDNAFFHCGKAFIRSHFWDKPEKTRHWKGLKPFKCVRKVRESSVITSFYFVPSDGGALPTFRPGQHVPIELKVPGEEEPVRRVYSLSNRPGDDAIRITVKREQTPAVASPYLHEWVNVGVEVGMRYPKGSFVLNEESDRPVVLLSAGVGLTPMISMMEHLVATESHRRIWFVHAAKSGDEHAMTDLVRQIARDNEDVRVHIAYGNPREEDVLGRDFDTKGRLSVETLKTLLPWDDYEFYLCGPVPFMKAFADGLTGNGVLSDRIRWESFSSEKLEIAPVEAPSAAATGVAAANSSMLVAEGTNVEFRRSGKIVEWPANCKSLLDLAEANNVPVRFSCRTGDCFSCASKLLSGEVTYTHELEDEPDEGAVLLCTAVPKSSLVLDL
jgi:ferredoxin-NADP reductase